MGLYLYHEPAAADVVTADNYVRSPHDALNGSWFIQKLYLRNDDASQYFTDIALQIEIPSVTDAPNASSKGNIYQLIYGDVQPTDAELRQVPFHNTLGFPDIGAIGVPDVSTYYPFFLRIYCRGESPVGKLTEATWKIDALQNAV